MNPLKKLFLLFIFCSMSPSAFAHIKAGCTTSSQTFTCCPIYIGGGTHPRERLFKDGWVGLWQLDGDNPSPECRHDENDLVMLNSCTSGTVVNGTPTNIVQVCAAKKGEVKFLE